jgi:hypothetical protein
MKISDLITSVQNKFDLARNLLRYNPLNASGRQEIVDTALDRGREKLEDVEIPRSRRSQPTRNPVGLADGRDYNFEPAIIAVRINVRTFSNNEFLPPSRDESATRLYPLPTNQ